MIVTRDQVHRAALALAEAGIPDSAREEDGRETGHYSATAAEMRRALGRPLRPAETLALILSRGYVPQRLVPGPAQVEPVVDLPEWVPEVWRDIWPFGNPTGAWLTWWDLVRVLEASTA